MGSENTLNGKHFPLELHIVHYQPNKKLMKEFKASVVAILFELSPDSENSWADDCLQRLFNGSIVDT